MVETRFSLYAWLAFMSAAGALEHCMAEAVKSVPLHLQCTKIMIYLLGHALHGQRNCLSSSGATYELADGILWVCVPV